MEWACHMILRTCQNNISRNFIWKDAEKEIGENITEWTGKVLSDNLRRAEDREKWCEQVVRCSDAPMII